MNDYIKSDLICKDAREFILKNQRLPIKLRKDEPPVVDMEIAYGACAITALKYEKELEIMDDCLTNIYNTCESAVPLIRACMDELEKLNKQNQ